MDLKHKPHILKGQFASCKHDPQLLRNKWANFFFNSTVMNETNYFLKMQYTTKSNAELLEETASAESTTNGCKAASSEEDLQLKHLKLVGFIESRLKGFLQTLQSEMIKLKRTKFSMTDPQDNLLIVPQSPFNESPYSSIYLIALPIGELTAEDKNCIAKAYASFDLRQASTIETGGWINHSSSYEIVQFADLPAHVINEYVALFRANQIVTDNYTVSESPPK